MSTAGERDVSFSFSLPKLGRPPERPGRHSLWTQQRGDILTAPPWATQTGSAPPPAGTGLAGPWLAVAKGQGTGSAGRRPGSCLVKVKPGGHGAQAACHCRSRVSGDRVESSLGDGLITPAAWRAQVTHRNLLSVPHRPAAYKGSDRDYVGKWERGIRMGVQNGQFTGKRWGCARPGVGTGRGLWWFISHDESSSLLWEDGLISR